MKIQELLYESNDLKENIAKVVTTITTNCQPFLHETNYQINDLRMFRGLMNYVTQVYDSNNELTNAPGYNPKRKPKDTPKYLHTELNRIFTKLFHFPFRNGTFVSGSRSFAAGYGNVSLTIPIGEFHYLWSPKVEDLFEHWQNFETETILHSMQTNAYSTNSIRWEAYLDMIRRNDVQYQTTNLIQGIKSDHEIMLYCDRCFVLPEEPVITIALKQIQNNHGAT